MSSWLLMLYENSALRISSIDEIHIEKSLMTEKYELKVTMRRGVIHKIGDFMTKNNALAYLNQFGIDLTPKGHTDGQTD